MSKQPKFQRNTCKTCKNGCALNMMEKMAKSGYQCWHPIEWFTEIERLNDVINGLNEDIDNITKQNSVLRDQLNGRIVVDRTTLLGISCIVCRKPLSVPFIMGFDDRPIAHATCWGLKFIPEMKRSASTEISDESVSISDELDDVSLYKKKTYIKCGVCDGNTHVQEKMRKEGSVYRCHGCSMKIQMKVKCSLCEGRGWLSDQAGGQTDDCERCDGVGYICSCGGKLKIFNEISFICKKCHTIFENVNDGNS